MVNDPIGDMLIQIKNATLARKNEIELPYSKLKKALGDILTREGYLTSVSKVGKDPKAALKINIAPSSITDVRRISKPGLRTYVNKHSIPTVLGGMGVAILSTPAGLMTGKEAKKRGIGGELMCKIW